MQVSFIMDEGRTFSQKTSSWKDNVSILGRIISVLNVNEYPCSITFKIHFHDAYQFSALGQLPRQCV